MSEIELPATNRSETEALLGDDPDLLKYAELFEKHSIRADVFNDLTADDLVEMGIPVMGHRIKIMRLVAQFNENLRLKSTVKDGNTISTDKHDTPVDSSLSENDTKGPEDGQEKLNSEHSSDSPVSPFAPVPDPDSPSARSIDTLIEDSEPSSSENIAALAERCESFELQIKKLSDQIIRLRSDILRLSKGSEPLPNPLLRSSSSPAAASVVTAFNGSAGSSTTSTSRKSPQDGYFVPRIGSSVVETPGSEDLVSPTSVTTNSTLKKVPLAASRVPSNMARINIAAANEPIHSSSAIRSSDLSQISKGGAQSHTPLSATSGVSNVAFFPPSATDGNLSAPATGLPSYPKRRTLQIDIPPQPIRTSSAPQVPTMQVKNLMLNSPSSATVNSPYGTIPEQLQGSNFGSRIDLSSGIDPLHSLRCNEGDNTVEVLKSMARKYSLEGDIKQWRLQLIYGDNVRDLLDHEHPLIIYKQMKETGNRDNLTFQARKVNLTKPPTDGNFI